jgi:hypothetical protein
VNPLLLYGVLGALLLSGAASTASYFIGRDHGRDACEERQREAEDKAGEKIGEVNTDAAARETVRQESHREIIREVPRIIDRPVYLNVCLDVDGVGLLDRAVSVANGETGRREPDAAVAQVQADPSRRSKP